MTTQNHRSIGSFGTSRSGNVAIMFSLVAFPMMLAIGFAVDYAHATRLRGDLQQVADAVVLTAIRSLPLSQVRALQDGTNFYEAAMEDLRAGLLTDGMTLRFETEPDFRAYVEITATAQGAFGNNIGLGTFRFEVDAEAMLARSSTEVALVLDYSASMETPRMRALGRSVEQFQRTLDGMSARSAEKFRMAIVPFSASVSIPSAIGANWLANPAERAAVAAEDLVCYAATNERQDASSSPELAGQFQRRAHTLGRFAGPCIEEAMMPLTQNRGRLQTMTQAMLNPPPERRQFRLMTGTSFWGTRIYEGAAWGLRALDPAWAAHWPAGSKPSGRPGTSKFMLLMTDGDNWGTVPYTERQADRMTLAVCEEAKRKGITVYTVAFRAPNSAKNLLKGCASSDNHAIEAETENALEAAFATIATDVGNPLPRLVH